MNRQPEPKIDVEDRPVREKHLLKRPQVTLSAYEALRENFDLEGWNADGDVEPRTAT